MNPRKKINLSLRSFETGNLSADNFKKYSTSMGRHLSPRYGQVVLVSGCPVLTAVNWSQHWCAIRDLSEISRGRGDGNRGRVTTFWDCREGRGHEKWAVKRGRDMQICVRDHVEVHPQMKKVLYFVKKKKNWEKQESRVINCQNQSRTLNAVI